MELNFAVVEFPTYDLKKLSKEEIENRVDELEIMQKYYGKEIRFKKAVPSPFRKDKNPSFNFFQIKGKIFFKDMATGQAGDCYNYVMLKFNISFWDALKVIDQDFALGLFKGDPVNRKPVIYENIKPEKYSGETQITIVRQSFNRNDFLYWKQFGINLQVLAFYNVVACEIVYINDYIPIRYTRNQPVYAYLLNNNIKIYRPLSAKKNRFRNNCNNNDVQGLMQLPKSDTELIITKSMKDVMTLHGLGYSAIAPQSESSYIAEDVIEELINKFDKFYVFFDNDFDKEENWGRILGKKMTEHYNALQIEIPTDYASKDISDLVRDHGIDKAKELMSILIIK